MKRVMKNDLNITTCLFKNSGAYLKKKDKAANKMRQQEKTKKFSSQSTSALMSHMKNDSTAGKL